MNRLALSSWFMLLGAAVSVSAAQTPRPANYAKPGSDAGTALTPDAAAQTIWGIMDLVQSRHIDPPTRQEMALGAIKALIKTAKGALPPYHLSERVSGLATFEQFRDLVRQNWPAKADAQAAHRMEVAMVEGLLAAVPANTTLLSPENLRVERQVAASRYTGIGVTYDLNREEHMPQIVSPFRGGPAHRAGVKPYDLIVAVDGKKTKGHDLEETASWVRGPVGTPVTIVFRQPHSSEERTITITRGVIPIETVMGYRLVGNEWTYRIDSSLPVGYACLREIHSSTLHELRQAESKMKAEGVRALVLDLRFVAVGTALHQAELVADSLVGGGLAWRTHDAQDQVKEFSSGRECLFRDWPLAILINEETADPLTQGLAAALHDHGRAVLIGETPKGDPYLRTEIELPDNLGGIMLRTARLERPAKDLTWTLDPDQDVETTPLQRAQIQQWLSDKAVTELPEGRTNQPPQDPQLAKATEFVREALRKAGQDRQAQNAR